MRRSESNRITSYNVCYTKLLRAAIANGIATSDADAVVIDGFKGGTGAAPKVFRDNVGIPIEVAIAAVDDRLREQGNRHKISIIASGGIRNRITSYNVCYTKLLRTRMNGKVIAKLYKGSMRIVGMVKFHGLQAAIYEGLKRK